MQQRVIRMVLFAALAFSAASCSKDDDTPPQTNATRIIGSWRETFRAPDTNGNGIIDSNERSNSGHYRVITFYTNGSVRDTSFINNVAGSIEASYTINELSLNILFPGIGPSRILQLDETNLQLRDTAARPQLVTGFRKL